MLRIGTGGPMGVYYPVGQALALGFSSSQIDSGRVAVAQTSGGSVANVQALARKEIEAGLVQADVAFQALKGEDSFSGNRKICLRAIASLYPERLQVLVRRDAIGETGTITIRTGRQILDQIYCDHHPGFIPGEFVQLTVMDNGAGMDQKTRKNLFEPFYTTKAVGKGTGLGLATVYGIVKQNNGFINVYSEPGMGAVFKIYLPRHIPADQECAPENQDPVHLLPPGHETVLLVEDEPAILEVTGLMLESLGYNVLSADTPGKALVLAEAHEKIHLLLTDVVMPEMNGRDLAGRLCAMHPDLKCLFMSGYTADVIAHHEVLDKGVHFLQKPFSKENLAARVRNVLDGL